MSCDVRKQSGREERAWDECSKRFVHHTKIQTIHAINKMMTKHIKPVICDDNRQRTESNRENKVHQFRQNKTEKNRTN